MMVLIESAVPLWMSALFCCKVDKQTQMNLVRVTEGYIVNYPHKQEKDI
jgi:hypothetical protein